MVIKQIITDSKSGVLSRLDERDLVRLCHTFAMAYLKIKASSNQLYMFDGDRLEDLAWDFIAELFAKNEEGELELLNNYFSECTLEKLSDAELKIELRKLVFSKVDDNVFRASGKKDPTLKKIIRNLKNAIKNTKSGQTVSYERDTVVINGDQGRGLPSMPVHLLQFKLCSRLEEEMNIPEILEEVISVLSNQQQYKKRISMVRLASVIRETYVLFNESSVREEIHPKVYDKILNREFEQFLEESVETVKMMSGNKYVNKGKLTKRELDLYLEASKDIVRDHFFEDSTDLNHYDYLSVYIPDLDYSEFRNNNRSMLEYLVKLVKKDIIYMFRKDWL